MAFKQGFRTMLPALFGGLLLGLAYPPTGLAFGFLVFVALVPFLISLETTERLRQAFIRAYFGTLVWNLIATYWVGGWLAEGNVDLFLMVSSIALTFFHPLLLSIPFLIYDVIRRRYGLVPALVMLPVAWIGFEYWRSTGDLAFPWLSLHNTQTYNLAYIQFIEFTGSYGLTFTIVAVNIALYLILRKRRIFGEGIARKGIAAFAGRHINAILIVILLVCIVLPYTFGVIRLQSESGERRGARVLIVQPNINPWAKWAMPEASIIDSMIRSTRSAIREHGKADLVVWPETAITYPITVPSMREDLEGLYLFLKMIDAPLLTGIPDKEYYRENIPQDAKEAGGGEYYRSWNASMLFYREPSGAYRYQRYHKQYMVPFGERVPFVDQFPFLGDVFRWTVGLGSWNRGIVDSLLVLPATGSRVTQPDTLKLAMLICYESVFPTYVQKSVARGADVIAIVTNDGWYGNSSGPYQHERYAILRAVENRRWVIRSANTGVSAVIDAKGNIREEVPFDASGSIIATVSLENERTLYGRIGDIVPRGMMWADGALVVFFIVTGFFRKKEQVAEES